MILVISSIKKSDFGDFFEAKCSEVTQHDLLGKLVYARFSKQKEVGFEFEVDDKRITQVKTKTKRVVNVLK